MAVAHQQQRPPHPVSFDVAYPERLSRVLIFFKLLLAIPQFIVVYLLLIVLGLLTVLAWFAILFTGRYPKAFFEFTSGVLRWQANVMAYVALLRDEYPPFSWEPGDYALTLDIPRAERQSRFRLFVRFITIIPNQIVFQFVLIGWTFTTFLSWWMILFTGTYPRGLFKFSVGVVRWMQRQLAYFYLLRDEYPPYSVNADARPGNELVSGIIGLPVFVTYIALYAFQLSTAFRGPSRVQVSLNAAAIERQQPTVRKGSLRLTLLDYEAGSGTSTAFDVRAEKDGFLPAYFSPYFFSLHMCDGRTYSVDDVRGTAFHVYFVGGRNDVTVYFRSPPALICDLRYAGPGGAMEFAFR